MVLFGFFVDRSKIYFSFSLPHRVILWKILLILLPVLIINKLQAKILLKSYLLSFVMDIANFRIVIW